MVFLNLQFWSVFWPDVGKSERNKSKQITILFGKNSLDDSCIFQEHI